MIYRPATPIDGSKMLQLIESHPTGGKIRVIYSRRPDAYQSYLMECSEAETVLCIGDDGHLLAQATCLPRKLYIDRKAHTIGYITGLHKAKGAQVNIMKMLETGYISSSVKQFFCSILDDNQSTFDLFAKQKLICQICDYTTYLLHPAAIKSVRHNLVFHRATMADTKALLHFYNEVGSMYSYFPVFSAMHDFAGLSVSDFFILKDGDEIVAAGALWNQQAYKQYIVIGYNKVFRFAALCNPILRTIHYPPLPKVNETAHFAYISFLLCRENNPTLERILLGEISATARNYDFLAIGSTKETTLGQYLDSLKSIRIGSKLCIINYDRSGTTENIKMPLRFECALL